MSDILDFYREQAQSGLLKTVWLQQLQEKALTDLDRVGFPTRHHEEWKYTSLDAFLKKRFQLKQAAVARADIPNDVPVGIRLIIANGQAVNLEEVADKLPKGVIIKPWDEAIEEHAELIHPYLGQILTHEHGFQALNTAILQCGLFIYLPEDCQLPEPLLLTHWQDEKEQAVYLRHLIVADKRSVATVLEDFQGSAECSYFSNAITEVFAGPKATLNHYKIERESKFAYHIGHTAARLDESSEFNSHILALGGKLVRSDISIHFDKPDARCLLNGVYAPRAGQHIDHHTTIFHDVPHCESIQNYKGIISGGARAVFNGKVLVAKDAQKSVAEQQNKNLLLSANAEIDTKPQLEIDADDVVCSHGATVGQLDEEALFYLTTRGLEPEEARQFLIQAFAAENLNKVAVPELRDWMKMLLNRQLG